MLLDVLVKIYLEPIYAYYKELGGEKNRSEFMDWLNSSKFDEAILKA